MVPPPVRTAANRAASRAALLATWWTNRKREYSRMPNRQRNSTNETIANSTDVAPDRGLALREASMSGLRQGDQPGRLVFTVNGSSTRHCQDASAVSAAGLMTDSVVTRTFWYGRVIRTRKRWFLTPV